MSNNVTAIKKPLPLQALHLIVELQFHINTMASMISQHKFIFSLKILVREFVGGFFACLFAFKSHIKGHFILYQWKQTPSQKMQLTTILCPIKKTQHCKRNLTSCNLSRPMFKKHYEEYVNIAQTYFSHLKSCGERKEGGNQKLHHGFRDVQGTTKLYYKIRALDFKKVDALIVCYILCSNQ